MESAAIAKVAVAAAPYSIDKPYDYLVPPALAESVCPGVRVTVPFGRGNRGSEGFVLAVEAGRKAPNLKAVSKVLDAGPVLDGEGIALALFLRNRYFCTMYDAARAILPAGLWYRLREVYRLPEGVDLAGAREAVRDYPGGAEALDFLGANGGSGDLEQLKAACGDTVTAALKVMCKAKLLTCETEARRRIGDKFKRVASLAVSAEDALAEAEKKKRSAPAQSAALRLLASNGATAASELCYYTGATGRTLNSLEKAGLVAFTQEEDLRVPTVYDVRPGPAIVLNEEQEAVFRHVRAMLEARKPAAALLEGVTGSGKTEVYIRLVQEVLQQGRTAMVLVPEIVLTPQMMRKFTSYFGSQVVMLHSALKLSERYDQWKRVRRGDVSVVLGTRSAVFAPLKNLGLVILDEEQEGSYQSENPPRYHARDVAKFLCARNGAVLLLGSATPAVESAWAAREGAYRHELLRKRYNERALPQVVIADMRQEIRNGNGGSISESLRQEIEKNLAAGEQSILFLNRRGNSRMLLCGECGQAPECPRCSVPLTYHSANGRLMCHHCGHSEPAPGRCPACGGVMKRVGVGTQKVEIELQELFPHTKLLRMDADTVAEGHEKLLRRFDEEKIPILLGTQMVAKGLDFENVTLVGVLSADLSLYADNYRAAERTFALLTQVVGRAGRGERQGRAVIQTYTPGNDVIRAAAAQDYDRFYDSEIRLRRLRRDPPFADLIVFTVSGLREGDVLRGAAWLRDELRRQAGAPALSADRPEVLGPAPAPIVKVNNRYRYLVTYIGRNDKAARELASRMLKAFAARREHRGLHVFADCNPVE